MPGSRTDFGLLYQHKWPILQKAFVSYQAASNTLNKLQVDFAAFTAEQAHWLDAFGLFMALKQHFDGRSWLDWPEPYHSHQSISKNDLDPSILQLAESHKFYQFLFYTQWAELKDYANGKGVQIIGDIPIFVSLDSVEVWCNPEYFQVDNPNVS